MLEGNNMEAEGQNTDEILMQSVKNQNQEALNVLMSRYNKALIGYLRKFLGSLDTAQDVSQITWMNIWKNSQQFTEGQKFKPWMYGIARNSAIDFQRKDSKYTLRKLDLHTLRTENVSPEDLLATLAGTDREGEPISQLITEETRRKVQSAIAQLPEDLQKVLKHVVIEGKKYGDTAILLELPEGTVKSRLHNARIQLAEILRKIDEEHDFLPTKSQVAA